MSLIRASCGAPFASTNCVVVGYSGSPHRLKALITQRDPLLKEWGGGNMHHWQQHSADDSSSTMSINQPLDSGLSLTGWKISARLLLGC
eukprot:6179900-Alexandrium_andersonii.AAC.2